MLPPKNFPVGKKIVKLSNTLRRKKDREKEERKMKGGREDVEMAGLGILRLYSRIVLG